MPSRRVPRQINFHREVRGDQSTAPRDFNPRDHTLDESHGESQGVRATLRRTDGYYLQQTIRLPPPCTDTSHTLACGHIVASRDPRCSILCHDPRWGSKRSPHACSVCENANEESRFLASYTIIQARREELAQQRRLHLWSVPLAVWEAKEDRIDERESKLKNSLSHKCRRLLLRVGVEGIRERVERFEREAAEREARNREREEGEHEIFAQRWYEVEVYNAADELSRLSEGAADILRENLRRCSWYAVMGPTEEAEARGILAGVRTEIVAYENYHRTLRENADTAAIPTARRLEQARQELAQELRRVEVEVRSISPGDPNHADGAPVEVLQRAILERLAEFDRQLLCGDPSISDSVMLPRIQSAISVLREIMLVAPSAADNQ